MDQRKEDLDFSLGTAVDSTPFLTERLIADEVVRPAHTFISCYDDALKRTDVPLETIPNYRYLMETIRHGYARINEGRVELLPVLQPPQLSHRGILDQRTASSLRRFGVFGNPDYKHPTYLSAPNWCGETYSEMEDRSKIVILKLDTLKLLERRSIFIDPESITDYVFRSDDLNELGKMFMVLGGIPREAIKEYWFPY